MLNIWLMSKWVWVGCQVWVFETRKPKCIVYSYTDKLKEARRRRKVQTIDVRLNPRKKDQIN